MFKKIEIWILYLVLFLFFPVLIGFGSLVKLEMMGVKKFEKLSKTTLFLSDIPFNLKKLLSSNEPTEDHAPNNQLFDRFPSLDGFKGTPNSQKSYLLLSKFDGDLKEGVVELVDLTNFEVMHKWNPDIDRFNTYVEKVPEFENLKRDKNNARYTLRSPLLLEEGNLIFHHNSPLRKIDACSNLVFQNSKDRFHHSIEKDKEGNIWVPTYISPRTKPIFKYGSLLRKWGFKEDGIAKLSPDGKILFEKSIPQIFVDNGLGYLLFGLGRYDSDPTHLNDIQPVYSDSEFWKKGDLFLSIRNKSMIILYRPSTNEIIWKGTGPFSEQHDVDILDGHRIAIFNNNIKNLPGFKRIVDGNNEVMIYDFRTDEFSSYLKESLIKYDVRTRSEGTSQILTNGDLLIEESNSGRTLYFNANGSLAWSYLNRANNGKVYRVNWSRILYENNDLKNVEDFLQSGVECKI